MLVLVMVALYFLTFTQIFFDEFYGEGFEVLPGHHMVRATSPEPFAGIVWSGKGTINGNPLDAASDVAKEFLVVPNTQIDISNTGDITICIFYINAIDEIPGELYLGSLHSFNERALCTTAYTERPVCAAVFS